MQLKQKEEMGEVLHAIDFDQLQIENAQFVSKIDEKNSELSRLKLKTGNIIVTMNGLKENLENLTLGTEKTRNSIKQRKELILKFQQESEKVANDKKIAIATNHQLKQQITDYKVPEVLG